eukprot:759500-Hanusia_phi.AAC.1
MRRGRGRGRGREGGARRRGGREMLGKKFKKEGGGGMGAKEGSEPGEDRATHLHHFLVEQVIPHAIGGHQHDVARGYLVLPTVARARLIREGSVGELERHVEAVLLLLGSVDNVVGVSLLAARLCNEEARISDVQGLQHSLVQHGNAGRGASQELCELPRSFEGHERARVLQRQKMLSRLRHQLPAVLPCVHSLRRPPEWIPSAMRCARAELRAIPSHSVCDPDRTQPSH